jgi:hypothetical protein
MLRGKYQASLEFLTTYGWAIAVVILVLAILFSTGIFSFSSSVPNSISGFSSTPVSSVAANPTALEMDVGNNVGQPINITGIVVNSSGHSYSSFSCQNNYIYPGQSTICYVSGSFSNPAYISAEITYYIATNKKIYLSSTGNIVVSLSNVLVPAGVKYYVPITIKNTQTSPTPNPFQQMINVSSSSTPWAYINTSQSSYFGQNVEFFYSNGEVIPSWLEQYHPGYVIWWIKIGNIPSSSSITVYMGFASKTTNLFNTNNVGEAPQLSSTYAKYDEGANVFNFYDNFAGTSLSSNWVIGSGGSLSQNNGLTITSTASNIEASYEGLDISSPFVYDLYEEAQQTTTGLIDAGLGVQSTSNPTGATAGGGTTYGLWLWGTSSLSWVYFNNGNSGGGTTPTPALNTFYSYTVASSSSSAAYYINYNTQVGTASYGVGSSYIGFHADASDEQFVQWVRVRAYPPNGVMPSVIFGGAP